MKQDLLFSENTYSSNWLKTLLIGSTIVLFTVGGLGIAVASLKSTNTQESVETSGSSSYSQTPKFTLPTISTPTETPIPTLILWPSYEEKSLFDFFVNAGTPPGTANCMVNYAESHSNQIGLQFLNDSRQLVNAINFCTPQETPAPQQNSVYTCIDPIIGKPAPCVQDQRNPRVCVDINNGNAFRCQDSEPL